jgi:hypothetical protein
MTDQISLFEGENQQEDTPVKKKKRKKRPDRLLELIADFNQEGYAKGWYFAVGEVFKDRLDIRFTERMEAVLDERGNQVRVEKRDEQGNIKLKKDGTPKTSKKTRPVMKWTQGDDYCFTEGDILYDTPQAYLPLWKDALKHISLACQVVRAVPNTFDADTGKVKKGYVTFILLKPNEDRTKLETTGQYHLTQNEFVEYLRTGVLKEGAEGLKT